MNTIISCCVRLCFPYSVQSVSEKSHSGRSLLSKPDNEPFITNLYKELNMRSVNSITYHFLF